MNGTLDDSHLLSSEIVDSCDGTGFRHQNQSARIEVRVREIHSFLPFVRYRDGCRDYVYLLALQIRNPISGSHRDELYLVGITKQTARQLARQINVESRVLSRTIDESKRRVLRFYAGNKLPTFLDGA